MLAASGMGGRNGFTIAQYAGYSDAQIVALLTVRWDEEGQLLSETEDERSEAGSIETAGRDLPKPESVGLTDADLRWALSVKPNVTAYYAVMFWSIWKGRNKTHEEICDIWVKHLASRK